MYCGIFNKQVYIIRGVFNRNIFLWKVTIIRLLIDDVCTQRAPNQTKNGYHGTIVLGGKIGGLSGAKNGVLMLNYRVLTHSLSIAKALSFTHKGVIDFKHNFDLKILIFGYAKFRLWRMGRLCLMVDGCHVVHVLFNYFS